LRCGTTPARWRAASLLLHEAVIQAAGGAGVRVLLDAGESKPASSTPAGAPDGPGISNTSQQPEGRFQASVVVRGTAIRDCLGPAVHFIADRPSEIPIEQEVDQVGKSTTGTALPHTSPSSSSSNAVESMPAATHDEPCSFLALGRRTGYCRRYPSRQLVGSLSEHDHANVH